MPDDIVSSFILCARALHPEIPLVESRRALLLLAIAVASPGYGQSICRVYEYAELRDMPRAKLEEMSCEYLGDMYGMNKVALDEINAGHLAASQRASRDSNRCAQELERIERVLDSKFKAKAPPCPPRAK